MKKELLRLVDVSFNFNQEVILSNISFSVFKGDRITIVGSNGVGKTVLGKIMFGLLEPLEGVILYQNKCISAQERRNMIGYIPEENTLIDSLTVAENMLIGINAKKNCFLSDTRMFRDMQKYLDRYHLDLKASTLCRELSTAQKGIVHLLRWLIAGPDILIVDASIDLMNYIESEQIERIIYDISDQGTSIVYLSYDIAQARKFSNRVFVLKKGSLYTDISEEVYNERLHNVLMPETKEKKRDDHQTKNIVLAAQKISYVDGEHEVRDVDFTLYRGEIVGFIGLHNTSITALFQCFTGKNRVVDGRIMVNEKPIRIKNPQIAVRAGIRFCEDNLGSLMLDEEKSLRENLMTGFTNRTVKYGMVRKRYEKILLNEICAELDLNLDFDRKLSTLNYASSVKMAVLNCILSRPDILILNKITRGLDEKEMQNLFRLLDYARNRAGILLNLSKLENEMNMCDRIIVLGTEGIQREFLVENWNKGELFEYLNGRESIYG